MTSKVLRQMIYEWLLATIRMTLAERLRFYGKCNFKKLELRSDEQKIVIARYKRKNGGLEEIRFQNDC